MKSLYASLAPCRKEEEVKSEFCKFFKMKIFALRGIDHYTERVLFEPASQFPVQHLLRRAV